VLVRKFLHSKGFRYKLHDERLPGKPDIVLPKYKTIVEVHGCFWHGHKSCRYYKLPKTNVEFWKNKICKNIARDSDNEKKLTDLGWKIIVIWECQLKPLNKYKVLNIKLLYSITNILA